MKSSPIWSTLLWNPAVQPGHRVRARRDLSVRFLFSVPVRTGRFDGHRVRFVALGRIPGHLVVDRSHLDEEVGQAMAIRGRLFSRCHGRYGSDHRKLEINHASGHHPRTSRPACSPAPAQEGEDLSGPFACYHHRDRLSHHRARRRRPISKPRRLPQASSSAFFCPACSRSPGTRMRRKSSRASISTVRSCLSCIIFEVTGESFIRRWFSSSEALTLILSLASGRLPGRGLGMARRMMQVLRNNL